MSEPHPENRRPEAGDGAGADEPAAPDYAELLSQIRNEARGVGRDVADLFRVGADRVRLEARERGFRLIVLGWLATAVAAATILAAIFVVDGVAGLLTAVFGGRVWAGRLAAGLLVLGATGLAIVVRRAGARRRDLRRLKSKYAESERDRGDRS